MLENFALQILEVRQLVESRLASDEVKNEAFARLYTDLDKMKRHASFIDNKPIYIDMILLHDRMTAACESLQGETHSLISSLREELEEILERRDIMLIPVDKSGGVFNRQYQKVVGRKPVSDLLENEKVVRIVRNGFTCGDLVVRPQEVVTGRLHDSGTAPSNH